MRSFILVSIILIGCSKADIKPSDALTGHWLFQSGSVSGDFTILNTSNGYSLQAGGIFTIKGVTYTCDQFWIPLKSTGTIDIYLGSPLMNSSREAMLVFSINPSTLQYGVIQPTNVFYEIKTDNSLVHVKDPVFLQKR